MNREVVAIERAAFVAWPAAETEIHDGWSLRSAGGFSRRLNSVSATGVSDQGFAANLTHARRWYAARNLPLLFRVTPLVDPSVEASLDADGFRREGNTHVMVGGVETRRAPDVRVVIERRPSEDWIDSQLSFAGVDAAAVPGWLEILERVPAPAAFGLLVDSGRPFGAGFGVVVDGYLALFEVITDPGRLREGFGSAVVDALRSWGSTVGANRSFLQVLTGNRAAVAMYRGFDYEIVYDYWYLRDLAESP